MIQTLQSYVSRELIKTFLLTAIGLTLTFSLTGGVLNMIQAEVLTAVQMLQILTFVLPVATTLTLPVAALFACASVYGRFASDNEFDACKASGINILRLLWPAFGLSVFVALFTFTFSNFVIPKFVERLELMVRQDVQKIVSQSLRTRGHLKYGPYVLYAQRAEPLQTDANSRGLVIQEVAFLMLDGDNLSHCGTADRVEVEFETAAENQNPTVEATMYDVLALDVQNRRLDEFPHQPFNPMTMPTEMEQKPKWFDLQELIHYQNHPTELKQIQDEIAQLRVMAREAALHRHVFEVFQSGDRAWRIGQEDRRYEIRAKSLRRHPEDLRITLEDVTVEQWWDGRHRVYEAGRMTIDVKRSFAAGVPMVHLRLTENVTFVDSSTPSEIYRPRDVPLEAVPMPQHVLETVDSLSDAELLGVPEDLAEASGTKQHREYTRILNELDMPELNLGPKIEDKRVSVLKDVVMIGLEIGATLHSRLAFSASVLVMLVLAAGLAIILRGGQMLTAFAIAFFPGLMVVVMNVMGRSMAEKTGTQIVGIVVIWAGLVLLAIADAIILTRYLKR